MLSDDDEHFIRVEAADIDFSKPMKVPLYDGNRRVVLRRGETFDSMQLWDEWLARGLYRNQQDRFTSASATATVPTSIPVRSSYLQGKVAASGAASAAAAPPTGAEVPEQREILTNLEATKLRIGDPLYLQSGPEAPRLVVRLIGYLKNKGLVVTVPEAESELVMLRDGQTFVARFFSGQSACAFTTLVVRQTSVPYPHIHLSYPKEVRAREIRKGSRVDVEIIAAIATEGEGDYLGSGKIVNLSIGGGGLRAKTRLGQKDDVINVKFKIVIGGNPSYVVFDAVIRSVSEDSDPQGMNYLHGLQFINDDVTMGLALMVFVYQKIVGEG